MFLPPEFNSPRKKIYDTDRNEDSSNHDELTERLRKTLYYGKNPTTERSSLPVTDIAVKFFQEAAPRELGKVDHYYAASVSRRACISPCALMLSMVYIDRLKNRNPEYVQNVSSSDLFLISMMVASKYLYDEGVDEEVYNDEWAESAHMELEDLNELERHFLSAMDWSLFVKPQDFRHVLLGIEQRIAMSQGVDRGWFSYMDLMVLIEGGDFARAIRQVLSEVCKVMLVCSAAYLAGTLVIISSTASVLCLRSSLARPSTAPPLAPVTSSQNWKQGPDPRLVEKQLEDALTHNDSASWPIKTENDPSEELSASWRDRPNSYSIPGLMVLLAAKELVATFVSACVEKPSDLFRLTDMPKKLQYSCQRGFCDAMMDADRLHCDNVTDEVEDSIDAFPENDRSLLRKPLETGKCANCRDLSDHHDRLLKGSDQSNDKLKLSTCKLTAANQARPRNAVSGQCCCWFEWPPGGAKGNYQGAFSRPFSDVILGFRTGIQNILV